MHLTPEVLTAETQRTVVLMKELQDLLEAKGHRLEWADVIRDLDRLEDIEIKQYGKRFVLRTHTSGTSERYFRQPVWNSLRLYRKFSSPSLPNDMHRRKTES